MMTVLHKKNFYIYAIILLPLFFFIKPFKKNTLSNKTLSYTMFCKA